MGDANVQLVDGVDWNQEAGRNQNTCKWLKSLFLPTLSVIKCCLTICLGTSTLIHKFVLEVLTKMLVKVIPEALWFARMMKELVILLELFHGELDVLLKAFLESTRMLENI